MRIVSLVTFFLTIIGALNWLLVGLAKFDLVRWIFGSRSVVGRLIYDLVGVAGVTQLITFVMRAMKGKALPVTG